MTSVDIKWIEKARSGINQVYSSGMEYCLVSPKMEQCHNFVYCKDFLQDVIHGFLNNRKASIYSFRYDPESNPPVDMNNTNICIANAKDDKFLERATNSIEFVNFFCKKLHIKFSELFLVEKPHHYYKKDCCLFVKGSKIWMNSPPLISLYSLLLRVGMAHKAGTDPIETIKGIVNKTIEPYQRKDPYQIKDSIAIINKLIQHGYRKFFYIDSIKNYPADMSINDMHNNCGISSFSLVNNVSYWNRDKVKNLEVTPLI